MSLTPLQTAFIQEMTECDFWREDAGAGYAPEKRYAIGFAETPQQKGVLTSLINAGMVDIFESDGTWYTLTAKGAAAARDAGIDLGG